MNKKVRDSRELKAVMNRFDLVFYWINEGYIDNKRACDETYGFVLGVLSMVDDEEIADAISDAWTYFHMAIHPAYNFTEEDYHIKMYNKF